MSPRKHQINMAAHDSNGSSSRLRISLRAVIYQERDWWIAHCLELDLAAEGKTAADAIKNIFDLIDIQVTTALEQGDIESIFRPAPSEFWKLFWLGNDLEVRRKPPKTVTRFEARELAFA